MKRENRQKANACIDRIIGIEKQLAISNNPKHCLQIWILEDEKRGGWLQTALPASFIEVTKRVVKSTLEAELKKELKLLDTY